MREKLTITKDNYKEVVLRKSIITCWVLLIICFIVKICGGNFFNISCDNERFVNFCNYIDKTIIKYVMYYISFITQTILMYRLINPIGFVTKRKHILFLIICSVIWCLKLLIENINLKIPLFLLDIIDLIAMFVLLYSFTKKFKRTIIAIMLLFIFPFISAITKNIGLSGVITDSYFITTCFIIDMYIMLILACKYAKLNYIRRMK